jgi:hypothetical protein
VLEYKEPGQYRPHRVFYIEHFDGSRTTFSIDRKCYGGLPPQVRMRDVIGQCCGASIRDIARDHKQRAFPEGRNSVFVCEATGATLSWDDAHVDHSGKWPISRIADEWINGKMPLSWELIVPGEFGAVLRPDIAEDFVKFHNDRAVLQVIHKTHNLSKGSGGYERKRSSTKLS